MRGGEGREGVGGSVSVARAGYTLQQGMVGCGWLQVAGGEGRQGRGGGI